MTDITIPEQDLVNLHWMARRYADGRSSYAPGLFNEITRKLIRMGVDLNMCDGTPWARDAMGPEYCGLTQEEYDLGGHDTEFRMWQDRIKEAVSRMKESEDDA